MDFPNQISTSRPASGRNTGSGAFDPRDLLKPRRLTIAMWDQAFLLRHGPGGSFQDFDRVLDETIERGYNTVRLDPMLQWIDLSQAETILHWPDPKKPFIPWNWNTEVKAPVGRWLIDFMEKLLSRPFLHYTLSAWWATGSEGPPMLREPRTHAEGAEMWVKMLLDWKARFGFERLVYVDLANEVPYFFPGFMDRFKQAVGKQWWEMPAFTPEAIAFLAQELGDAMKILQREFPELRFTASIHGDLRWLDVPLEFDCLDVHFYSDADPRWTNRTRFNEFGPKMFHSADWHAEFSERTRKAHASIAPMLRARQRSKLADFAASAHRRGAPLTTSESWSSWYMYDTPEMDWAWLLEWAEWSVEDAIEFGMWGWTPHNYVQPQFANWNDLRWHQRLTHRFLHS